MTNNSTNVIPFHFGKQQVRTLLIDDQPWFVAADVSSALLYAEAKDMTRNLDDDEKGRQIVPTPGGAQEMLVINESGLYSAILRSRKTEAKRFKKWVTAEVLPAIRKHGRYEDSGSKMATLMDELIGMTELNVIKGLIRDKGKAVPADKRHSFALMMHSRLRTRFNVPRTELISAGQFEAACNFIAAYAVEGEYLPKEGDSFPTLQYPFDRLLVWTDCEGKRQFKLIPRDAYVLNRRQMIDGLITGDVNFSTSEMFELLAAATENLRIVSRSQARRVAA
ncbi:phage repressor protein [Pseudomonas capeferrum]|nr:phage repressor protein [Pseudomonas capeferrum]